MFLLAKDTAATGGYGLIGVAVVFLAVVWVLFPFIVNGKMNSLIREARAARAEADKAAKAMLEEQKKATEYLKYLSERAYDIAAKPDAQKHVPPAGEQVYRID